MRYPICLLTVEVRSLFVKSNLKKKNWKTYLKFHNSSCDYFLNLIKTIYVKQIIRTKQLKLKLVKNHLLYVIKQVKACFTFESYCLISIEILPIIANMLSSGKTNNSQTWTEIRIPLILSWLIVLFRDQDSHKMCTPIFFPPIIYL